MYMNYHKYYNINIHNLDLSFLIAFGTKKNKGSLFLLVIIFFESIYFASTEYIDYLTD